MNYNGFMGFEFRVTVGVYSVYIEFGPEIKVPQINMDIT